MDFERIEHLRAQYAGRCVQVDAQRPEWARFRGRRGRIKTINYNGRALVQWEGDSNRAWYDIELGHLRLIEERDSHEPIPPA